MTGRDAPHPDMPNFPWSGRRDVPAIEDSALAGLLRGAPVSGDAESVLAPVAEVLAVLTGPATEDELAGEAAALAEFRRRPEEAAWSRAARRRRPRALMRLIPAPAAAAAALVLGLGGVATAAYTGSLPASLQRIAHGIIGAPDAAPGDQTGGGGTGPAPTSPSALRLCTAYDHAKAAGTAAEQSAALRRLVQAAGGADKVSDYCATASSSATSPSSVRLGATPTPAHSTPAHPTGKPTALPTATASHSHTPHPSSSPHFSQGPHTPSG